MIGNHKIGQLTALTKLGEGDAHRPREMRMLQIPVLLKHHHTHDLANIAVQEPLALLNTQHRGSGAFGDARQLSINGEKSGGMTGGEQDLLAGAYRIAKNTGILFESINALGGTNRILSLDMRAVRVQTSTEYHDLKNFVIGPILRPYNPEFEVLIVIEKPLNMRKVILARCSNIARDAGRIKISGKLVARHCKTHTSSVAA